MKIDVDYLKLYIVEFGKPSMGMSFFGNPGPPPLFVMATGYDEAERKAMEFMANKPGKRNVIDSDGSLNMDMDTMVVKSVRLACDEIIW